jgi:phospholipase/carboxylesterase/glyoxalase family protein
MSAPDLGFVHRFKPAQSTLAPTLLLLHGTGGTEDDLVSLGEGIAPEAALLSPRGKILENGMSRFFRRLSEGVFDLEDLQFRTHELADWVQAAATDYNLDAAKVLGVGYSNGANIAASTLLLRPETLRGAILLHPMVPLVPEIWPDLSGKPVFISAGRRDPLVTPQETERLAELLEGCGADITIFWHDGGHNLTQDEFAAAQAWYAKVSHAF